MAIVVTDNCHYQNIADAIRNKTGEAVPYMPSEMPAGVAEVYEAGKKSEYDAFWDAAQNYGNRTAYQYAFAGAAWRSGNFKPKYDMKPVRSDRMFAVSEIAGDLVETLNNCDVSIDTSASQDVVEMYAYSGYITHVGVHDLRSASDLRMMFYSAYSIATIDKLILKENGSQSWNYTFYNCSGLQNLTIEGTIGQNGFNVQWSTALTHDSLMSIINALADYSEDTGGTTWSVTLGTKNLAKLTDSEKAIATQKGWTLA